jgi:putative oxidoreductase
MSNAMILTGRFLLGLYFLVPGLMKFAAPDMHVALMEAHNVPMAEPLMWIAAVMNVAGGVLLIFGRYVRLVALGFVVYILLVNGLLHDFWNEHAGVSSEREMQNFIKNLGILAGLLVLAGHGEARPFTLRGWWRSDRAGRRSRDEALVAGSIPR